MEERMYQKPPEEKTFKSKVFDKALLVGNMISLPLAGIGAFGAFKAGEILLGTFLTGTAALDGLQIIESNKETNQKSRINPDRWLWPKVKRLLGIEKGSERISHMPSSTLVFASR
jgi:hypothetical protein